VIGGYIAALIIIPLFGLIFIGQSFIQPIRLIIIFSELIIGPLLLSQIFIKIKVDKYILRFKGFIVNWGLFVVIFTVIGLNRNVFFNEPLTLAKIFLICFVTVIGLGLLYEFLTRRLKIDPSIILLGVVKNGGFASATALALFGEKASLPGAVVSVFIIIFLLYLNFRARKV
jgi:BASS family bile acid:Na+ symporter